METLPCYGPHRHDGLRTRYLWDRLDSEIVDFAIEPLNRTEPKARRVRLVEVEGLYGAEKVLGDGVWEQFED